MPLSPLVFSPSTYLNTRRMAGSSSEIEVGGYVLERLVQLGVRAVFGVPGDFNLTFLDLIVHHPTLQWYGCCNELNAAYAADGYARTTKGLGCLVTTFGVGELSVVNGLAGSYAERVPVVHLVGTPATSLQKNGILVHHTFGDGRFDVFRKIAASITVDQCNLGTTSLEEAAASIDRLLTSAYEQRRPVYIEIPTDVAFKKMSSAPLQKKFTKEKLRAAMAAKTSEGDARQLAEQIANLYKQAKKPMFLVDVGAQRHDLVEPIKAILNATNVPYVLTPMSKSAIHEECGNFLGMYAGHLSSEEVYTRVEASDFTVSIGRMPSNLNTGSFTHVKNPGEVSIQFDRTVISGKSSEISALSVLAQLSDLLPASPEWCSAVKHFGYAVQDESLRESTNLVRQDKIWPIIATYLRKDDAIVTEIGCSNSGLMDVNLPPVNFESSTLWGSIGWAAGASYGASVAAREQKRRCVLFTGEGAFQETIQDLSMVIKNGLTPTIFLINNSGFTIERIIHGETETYNDVPDWQWQNALTFLGAKKSQSHSIRTYAELFKLLADPNFVDNYDTIKLVEIHTDPLDAPPKLARSIEIVGRSLVHTNFDILTVQESSTSQCKVVLTLPFPKSLFQSLGKITTC